MLQTAPKDKKDLFVLLTQRDLYFYTTDHKQPRWIRTDKHPLLLPMSESDVETLMMERKHLLGKFLGICLVVLFSVSIVVKAFAR